MFESDGFEDGLVCCVLIEVCLVVWCFVVVCVCFCWLWCLCLCMFGCVSWIVVFVRRFVVVSCDLRWSWLWLVL